MALTISTFKCNSCGEFEGTSEDWIKCKCGKNEVQAGYFTAFKGERNFKTLRSSTYYSEEDVFIFDDELSKLYSDIEKVSKEVGFFVTKLSEKTIEGGRLITDIYISDMGFTDRRSARVSNEVRFELHLDKNYYTPNRDEIKNRMELFLEFLNKLRDEEFDLDSRRALVNFATKSEIFWDEKQVEEYDYTFYF